MAEVRSIRVVVFSDVVDSTGRMFRDEAAAVRMIQSDLSGFEQQIRRHGGTLIKFTGDGILATFDTTSTALSFIEAAVLDLQDRASPGLQHRFGMHLGEIYLKDDDILGQGVHLTARLQTISPANGVAFTESTYANLDPRFRSRAVPLGALELKGIAGRIRCYAIEERGLLPIGRRHSAVRGFVLRGDALLRRLATSQRRQLFAALAALLLGLIADLDPANPLSAYLLDRRLVLQKTWRQLTVQPGPTPPVVPVILLPSDGAPVSRSTLADLLESLPPSRFPAVAFDYVLDQVGPDPAAMTRLVQVIGEQRRPLLVLGWFSAESAGVDAGERSRPLAALRQAGAQERNLILGTAAGPGPVQPRPLQLLVPLGAQHFAAALAGVIRPQLPPPLRAASTGLPSEAVIDWSLAWERGIHVLDPDGQSPAGPLASAPLVVVGSLSSSRQPDADLFGTPAAFRSRVPLWGGSVDEMPGVIAQTVVGQSLALGHWLTPLSASGCAALAAGLGVLAAAAIPASAGRWRLLAVGVPVAGLVSLQLAVGARLLVPIALPTLALAGTSLLRRES
jgi:class 3 adenylate cyclase